MMMKIKKPTIIGMIHLPPTASFSGWPGINSFIRKAKKDLMALQAGGVDAALIENDEDQPCKELGDPDVVVPMTLACRELNRIAKIPLGVEVLLNDPLASLTIAKLCNLSFIRTDYFVDRMRREGYGEFKIDPVEIISFREKINAKKIEIFADIQVKQAKMVKKKPIAESAQEALHAGADAVVVTGRLTGEEPKIKDLEEVSKAIPGGKILIGSGFSEENGRKLLKYAQGALVGTSIKRGRFIDQKKVKRLIEKIGGS